MPEIATSVAGTGKRACLLWQIACQSVGQPIDWAASACNLCLPFLSHLKGEVSGSDRVMYKSSTWLVTPRWALYQSSSLSSCKKLQRKRQRLMWNDWEGYTVQQSCRAKNSMNIMTLSTLIRMKLLLASPLPWLNLTSWNGPCGVAMQRYRMKWKFAIFQQWLLYWTWQWWPSAGACLLLRFTNWKKL